MRRCLDREEDPVEQREVVVLLVRSGVLGVRDLVHDCDPEVAEMIKRSRQPYFVLHGNICALLGTKDHVNVFLLDGGIVADPENIITGGHANKTARTISNYHGDELNKPALAANFAQIIKDNRARGWRKLTR